MFRNLVQLGVRANRLNNPYVLSTLRPVLVVPTKCTPDVQQRFYKNFGHKPDKVPRFTKVWYSILVISFILIAVDYRWYFT